MTPCFQHDGYRHDCADCRDMNGSDAPAPMTQEKAVPGVELLIARVEDCQRDCPAGHNNLSGRLTAIRETLVAFTRPDEQQAATIAELREAATLARPIIQDERDVMVECHSCPPDKNATDFDPEIREDIERMDAALAAIDSALAKVRP